MKTIDNSTDLMDLLESIQMLGTRLEDWNFRWSLNTVYGEAPMPTHPHAGAEEFEAPVAGWLVACSFERPDANGTFDEQGIGYGRDWFVAPGTPVTGVVFTAWMAVQQILMHELHESFTVMVDGERVRLLDPHKELADLAVGSRRVDDTNFERKYTGARKDKPFSPENWVLAKGEDSYNLLGSSDSGFLMIFGMEYEAGQWLLNLDSPQPNGPWKIEGHIGNYQLIGADDEKLGWGVQPDLARWMVRHKLAMSTDSYITSD